MTSRLRGESNLTFQEEVAKSGLHISILFMTDHGDVKMSVKTMKADAIDFFSKPFRNQVWISRKKCAVHWVDPDSGEIVNKPIKRAALLEYFANRLPCLIRMESCGGSQHWARRFIEMGHHVKLMPAKFVKSFVTGNKNDSADARAI